MKGQKKAWDSIAPPPRAPLSRGRKWLYRLSAMILVPCLFLGLAEVALRLAGYGHPTGFFKTVQRHGQDWRVANDDFSLRFFPPELARFPKAVAFPATKPENSCRIFILGESAAMGDPDPAFSASRYLEALLEERFPGRRFEVINVAFTAINSHVILPIARDCARQQGDFWIVYMGNNEMVGPFGAATVFGSQAPPLALVRLDLAIQRTRAGQLLAALAHRVKGKPANQSWGGMKMFLSNKVGPRDARKEVVYGSFKKNLDDILQAGLDSGAQIVLNTVAVNLADCPPLASVTNHLAETDGNTFDKLFAEAVRAQTAGDASTAARQYDQTSALAPDFAEAQFRLGQCQIALSNYRPALNHLQKARDLDALPFRADGQINDLIGNAAGQAKARGLCLVDAASILGTNNPAGACGQESFFEHVHLNPEGNYRLARLWAAEIARMAAVSGSLPSLREAASSTNAAGETWASQAVCERRLGLTDWNRYALIEQAIWRLHRPPLEGRFNTAEQVAFLEGELSQTRARMTPQVKEQALSVYADALKRDPNDHWLHENFAQFLEGIGQAEAALAQWQAVRELLPDNFLAYFQVGRIANQAGHSGEAQANLERAVALRPTLAEGWFELGNACFAQGAYEQAFNSFQRAAELEPLEPSYAAWAGKALSKMNRRDEAIQRYQKALELRSDFWEAHEALGDELVQAGKIPEAQVEYEAVTRLQPTNALAHLNVGVMLARQGRADEALRQFDETLRLDPNNRTAIEYRDRVEKWKQGSPRK